MVVKHITNWATAYISNCILADEQKQGLLVMWWNEAYFDTNWDWAQEFREHHSLPMPEFRKIVSESDSECERREREREREKKSIHFLIR